jgi:hypothetical protein
MTPRSLFAVLLASLGVSYICGVVTMLLGIISGPFASLIVGGILLAIAAKLYGGTRSEEMSDTFT